MAMQKTAEMLTSPVDQEFGSIDIDYYRNPLLARRSIAQLLLRPGLMGFSNLVWVSGDWRSLASPFCRLGRELPLSLESAPEFAVQESTQARMIAAFSGPDSIVIEVDSKISQMLYSGAPGKIHHNGGTAQQQWMAFDAFRQDASLEQIDEETVVARNGAYLGVFKASGIRLAEDGNGWSVPVIKGRTYVGVGVAFGDLALGVSRAASALRELRRQGGISPTCLRLQTEWQELFSRVPGIDEMDADLQRLVRNAIWCLYSNVAPKEGFLSRECVVASKIQYPGLYPWDSAFAAVALKEVDPVLAKGQILAYTDRIKKTASGEVGEMTALHSNGGAQFPLFSWAAWKIHEAQEDLEFLGEIYEPLARHAAWWLRPEAVFKGIPAYMRVVCLDDSPRFDMFSAEGRMSLKEPVLGADLISICAMDQLYLAKIAETLKKPDQAAAHREVATRLIDFIEAELYDQGLHRYIDLGVKTGRRGTVNTPMNHFPALLSPSAERRAQAAKALSRRGPFFGRYGLATVSPEEASFDPCRIWRGPIWFNINLLCAEACAQMGYQDEAAAIAESTIEILKANDPLPNGVMEYYNYQNGQGSGAHHIATLGAAPFLSFVLDHQKQVTPLRLDS